MTTPSTPIEQPVRFSNGKRSRNRVHQMSTIAPTRHIFLSRKSIAVMRHDTHIPTEKLPEDDTSTNEKPVDSHPPTPSDDPPDPIDLYKRDRELTRQRGYSLLFS